MRLLLICCLMLSGCSTVITQSKIDANTRSVHELVERFGLDPVFDTTATNGQQDTPERLSASFEAAQAECLPAYFSALREGFSDLATKPDQMLMAKHADKLNECVKPLGVKITAGVEKDGVFSSYESMWFRLFDLRNERSALLHQLDQDRYSDAVLYTEFARSLQGNIHYVQPHVREGSFVNGYWRSNPDGTCLNNLRGCR